MMDLIKKYQSLIGVAAVIIAGFIAYSIFFTHPVTAPLTATPVSEGQSAVDEQLIVLLLKLHAITLDNKIFSDPRFQSLHDFSQALVPVPSGRVNPFAPLGSK